MSTAIVILGPPATGKTYLRDTIAAQTGWPSLAIDDYRAPGTDTLTFKERSRDRARAWFHLVTDAETHLADGTSVVIEGCLLTVNLHLLIANWDHRLIVCSADEATRRQRLEARDLTTERTQAMLEDSAPPTTRRHLAVDTTNNPNSTELLALVHPWIQGGGRITT